MNYGLHGEMHSQKENCQGYLQHLCYPNDFVFTLVLGLIFYEDPMTQYNNGIHAEDGGRWTYDGFMISKNRSRSRY